MSHWLAEVNLPPLEVHNVVAEIHNLVADVFCCVFLGTIYAVFCET